MCVIWQNNIILSKDMIWDYHKVKKHTTLFDGCIYFHKNVNSYKIMLKFTVISMWNQFLEWTCWQYECFSLLVLLFIFLQTRNCLLVAIRRRLHNARRQEKEATAPVVEKLVGWRVGLTKNPESQHNWEKSAGLLNVSHGGQAPGLLGSEQVRVDL